MQIAQSFFINMGPIEILLVTLITLFAGVVKGLVGFAMPLIMISGFAMFLPIELSISAMIIPTLVTNMFQAFRNGKKTALNSLKMFWKYLAVLLIMILVGSRFFTLIKIEILFLLMGSSIFIFTLFQFRESKLKFKNKKVLELTFGFFAGFFGGLTGTWGPPTVTYFSTLELEKNFQLASQGIIYFLCSMVFIFAHIQSNIINLNSITFSFLLLAPALSGVFIGNFLGTKIDGLKFTKLTQFCLLLASLNLIRRGLGW